MSQIRDAIRGMLSYVWDNKTAIWSESAEEDRREFISSTSLNTRAFIKGGVCVVILDTFGHIHRQGPLFNSTSFTSFAFAHNTCVDYLLPLRSRPC